MARSKWRNLGKALKTVSVGFGDYARLQAALKVERDKKAERDLDRQIEADQAQASLDLQNRIHDAEVAWRDADREVTKARYQIEDDREDARNRETYLNTVLPNLIKQQGMDWRDIDAAGLEQHGPEGWPKLQRAARAAYNAIIAAAIKDEVKTAVETYPTISDPGAVQDYGRAKAGGLLAGEVPKSALPVAEGGENVTWMAPRQDYGPEPAWLKDEEWYQKGIAEGTVAPWGVGQSDKPYVTSQDPSLTWRLEQERKRYGHEVELPPVSVQDPNTGEWTELTPQQMFEQGEIPTGVRSDLIMLDDGTVINKAAWIPQMRAKAMGQTLDEYTQPVKRLYEYAGVRDRLITKDEQERAWQQEEETGRIARTQRAQIAAAEWDFLSKIDPESARRIATEADDRNIPLQETREWRALRDTGYIADLRALQSIIEEIERLRSNSTAVALSNTPQGSASFYGMVTEATSTDPTAQRFGSPHGLPTGIVASTQLQGITAGDLVTRESIISTSIVPQFSRLPEALRHEIYEDPTKYGFDVALASELKKIEFFDATIDPGRPADVFYWYGSPVGADESHHNPKHDAYITDLREDSLGVGMVGVAVVREPSALWADPSTKSDRFLLGWPHENWKSKDIVYTPEQKEAIAQNAYFRGMYRLHSVYYPGAVVDEAEVMSRVETDPTTKDPIYTFKELTDGLKHHQEEYAPGVYGRDIGVVQTPPAPTTKDTVRISGLTQPEQATRPEQVLRLPEGETLKIAGVPEPQQVGKAAQAVWDAGLEVATGGLRAVRRGARFLYESARGSRVPEHLPAISNEVSRMTETSPELARIETEFLGPQGMSLVSFMAAAMDIESNGRVDAYNEYSGASGVYQLAGEVKNLAQERAEVGGTNVFDPSINIAVGIEQLVQNLKWAADAVPPGARGPLGQALYRPREVVALALALSNWGYGSIRRVGKSNDLWQAWMEIKKYEVGATDRDGNQLGMATETDNHIKKFYENEFIIESDGLLQDLPPEPGQQESTAPDPSQPSYLR